MRLTYEFPALGTILDTRDFVVGAGVEAPGFPTPDPRTNTDFSAANITSLFVSSSTWTASAFNGYHVFDLNGAIADISNVTINGATNMVGLDASRVTFDSNNIWVNWNGLNFDTSTVVSIDVEFVPEPSTFGLIGLGIAGVIALRRK